MTLLITLVVSYQVRSTGKTKCDNLIPYSLNYNAYHACICILYTVSCTTVLRHTSIRKNSTFLLGHHKLGRKSLECHPLEQILLISQIEWTKNPIKKKNSISKLYVQLKINRMHNQILTNFKANSDLVNARETQ